MGKMKIASIPHWSQPLGQPSPAGTVLGLGNAV